MVEQLTQAFIEKIVSKTEHYLKMEMISRHLTLADVKMVKIEDDKQTDLFIDIRNRKIILKRYIKKRNLDFPIGGDVAFELVIEVLNEDVPDSIFKSLVDVNDVKFVWDKVEGNVVWYRIVLDDEKDADLASVLWKGNGVWSIQVAGLPEEFISGYDLEDLRAVLKIAEGKIYDTIEQIQYVIKARTRR
jgi:hypothetical protein